MGRPENAHDGHGDQAARAEERLELSDPARCPGSVRFADRPDLDVAEEDLRRLDLQRDPAAADRPRLARLLGIDDRRRAECPVDAGAGPPSAGPASRSLNAPERLGQRSRGRRCLSRLLVDRNELREGVLDVLHLDRLGQDDQAVVGRAACSARWPWRGRAGRGRPARGRPRGPCRACRGRRRGRRGRGRRRRTRPRPAGSRGSARRPARRRGRAGPGNPCPSKAFGRPPGSRPAPRRRAPASAPA